MVPVGGLVGGCGARAVSRKTPIYFIIVTLLQLVMVGLSSPWGGSKSSRPDGWRLTALVFGHLSALD